MRKLVALLVILSGCAAVPQPAPVGVSREEWEAENQKIVAVITAIGEYVQAVQARGMLPTPEDLRK